MGKLMPLFYGPFEIKREVFHNCYELVIPRNKRTMHRRTMRRFFRDTVTDLHARARSQNCKLLRTVLSVSCGSVPFGSAEDTRTFCKSRRRNTTRHPLWSAQLQTV
ncbi:hypothetical protein PR048_021430 [Dryococelus australis]|uniref:Uncharacterized protein n=1 Tax=Dryococelus australis TaxID=614101 RepID=A0ABQ9GY82_9NEOP|nr:hypothetical protein PR048_021430 [Dryococelus australis]